MLAAMSRPTLLMARDAKFLVLAAIFITVGAYWTGLQGPFLLDDNTNLDVIRRWLAGDVSLGDVLMSRVSSPFGRPLAMASFALSAWLSGYTPFAFKLGNLLVHLACGAVIYLLVRRIALRDPNLRSLGALVAALVATLWLLHPLQVSTVLYAIQRMAQLSAFFMLSGMWLYMAARERLERGPSRPALTGLFIGVPLLTAAGFLCKENALLLPALCLVLELGCFRPSMRSRPAKLFFGAFLWLPAAAAAAFVAMKPAKLLGGYVQRDFTWWERLLTQARALCSYLWNIVAPNPPRMGVYTDDFALSTGLLSPPSTLVAIVALTAISVAAWHLRRRIPALFVGWGLFLFGHAIESTLFPLELYFEHRNYLPMLGVVYALVGLVFAAGERLRASGLRTGRIGAVLGIALVSLYAFGTHGRARVWGDEQLLVESAAATHPGSMRAQLAVVSNAIARNDLARARQALTALTRSAEPRVRAQGHLNRINLDCAARHTADPADLQSAIADAPTHLSTDEAGTFRLLFRNTRKPCAGVNDQVLGSAASHFASRATRQPDRFGAKAELRYVAAQFYARAGDWESALPQAKLAWQPNMPAAAAVLLIQGHLANGDIGAAERIYAEAERRADPTNGGDVAGMRWLRAQIVAAREKSPLLAR
jgi:hypothetical protein